jgi:hypothetical protein
VNDGGWLTERQWDRWDKGNAIEKLGININFHLQTLKSRGSLGDLGLDEI